MGLLRNKGDGKGKYAIVRLDKLAARVAAEQVGKEPQPHGSAMAAIRTLEALGLIEYGEPNTEHEFFVIKLKDTNARAALLGYAAAADMRDKELADDVYELAGRASDASPWCKEPD